ncbi:MAG TPA: ornithine carbamoyltransferase [Aggregatilineaceae bacterium]|nr:ornithine carbamoyltransferase [Aggregatilineaceae bacterium]
MKHFLDLADWSCADLQAMLDYAVALKKEYKDGGNDPILAGKSLALVFQKPSLRTRVSFEMGMVHLGGYAFYLSPQEIGLGKRESIADIARVLGGYVNGVMARVFDHQHVIDLARWSPVPIINGLSDYNHPCQGMADLLTIYEEYGKLEGLKLTYVGDSNNVCNTLIVGAAIFGMNMAVASPEGFQPKQDVIDQARRLNSAFEISISTDPAAAVQGADVIYTDTWTSMGQEEEAEQRRKVFPPYQVNEALISQAKPDVIVMHCLPAHRGEEITDEVADGSHSRLFPQAENRLHAQKAILVYLLAPKTFEKWQKKQSKKK